MRRLGWAVLVVALLASCQAVAKPEKKPLMDALTAVDEVLTTSGSGVLFTPGDLAKAEVTVDLADFTPDPVAGLQKFCRDNKLSCTPMGRHWVVTRQPVEPTITLELKGASVQEGLDRIMQRMGAAGGNLVVEGPLPDDRRVSLKLEEVPAREALRLFAQAAGITAEQTPTGTWVVRPGAGMVRVGDANVPVLGAMVMPGTPGGGVMSPELATRYFAVPVPEGAGSAAGSQAGWGPWAYNPAVARLLGTRGLPNARAEMEQLKRLKTLISLQAKDEPLAKFMAGVAKLTGQRIEVDPAVSPQIKVTATIAGLPADEVIASVAGQAGLMVRVDPLDTTNKAGLDEAQAARVVHIVPVSSIEVTGPGISPRSRIPGRGMEGFGIAAPSAPAPAAGGM